LDCIETIDMMDLVLEGTLPAEQRVDFVAHIDECFPCRTYFEQLGLTVRTLGAIGTPRATNPRRDELIARFERRKPNSNSNSN
jgi:predicted anti-sigma-YlaC factor YlaD